MKRPLILIVLSLLPALVFSQIKIDMNKTSTSSCDNYKGRISPSVEKCFKVKDQIKRVECVDEIGKIIPFGCEKALAGFKNQLINEEKKLYPKQRSALGELHRKEETRPLQEAKDTKLCNAHEKKIKEEGEKCLKVSLQGKRRACFDELGKKFKDDCDLVQYKSFRVFITKERNLYPMQGSALSLEYYK